MPDWEMEWLKSTMETEARDDTMSYSYRMKEHDIQKRLNLLFGPDQAEAHKADEQEDEIQSVNEEATTDT